MIKILFSGFPHGGKSTLLQKFEDNGKFLLFEEVETKYILEMKEKLGVKKTQEFIKNEYFKFKSEVASRQSILDNKIKKIDLDNQKIIICDRSAIDWIAYCIRRMNQENSVLDKVPELLYELSDSKDAIRYDLVFFFEPVGKFDIRGDKGRVMKEEDSIEIGKNILKEFSKRNYEVIRVPELSKDIEENLSRRKSFILDKVKSKFPSANL